MAPSFSVKRFNNEITLQSNIVTGWKKKSNNTVASGEYKVEGDTSSAAGALVVQGLSGKINKSIERHFLNTLPEEKKRFNLTAPKIETQQDTKLNIKTYGLQYALIYTGLSI